MENSKSDEGGETPNDDTKKEKATEEDPNAGKIGIPLKIFIKTYPEIKEKHPMVSEAILDALDLKMKIKSTVVGWKDFLRVQTHLRYYSATKEQYLYFWMRVLNPLNMPTLPMDEIYVLLELLARGTFTNQSTLVSEKFSRGFLKMLDNRKCIIHEKAKIQDDQSE